MRSQFGKEDLKVFPFADDMIVCKRPQNSTGKLLQLITLVAKCVDTRLTHKISSVPSYIQTTKGEKEVGVTTSFK